MDKKDLIRKTFNQFNGNNLESLNSFYSDDIVFTDPVKQIKGLSHLKHYYQEMYKNVGSIQFEFHRFIEDQNRVSGEWTMTLKVRGLNGFQPYTVKGASFFEFNQAGLVSTHRDYLDLGEMVYEKIPLFGRILKLIKQNL